jgi:hypothetical protein
MLGHSLAGCSLKHTEQTCRKVDNPEKMHFPVFHEMHNLCDVTALCLFAVTRSLLTGGCRQQIRKGTHVCSMIRSTEGVAKFPSRCLSSAGVETWGAAQLALPGATRSTSRMGPMLPAGGTLCHNYSNHPFPPYRCTSPVIKPAMPGPDTTEPKAV